MLRSTAKKVAWMGRTASMVFGLALVLALLFGVATMALGATGGNFILGKANSAGAVSKLTANIANPALQLVNTSTGAAATALKLTVASGKPPLTVNAEAGKATNLDADEIDGQEASDLAEPRGYAHVKLAGDVDPLYPSKGVNSVVIPTGKTSIYCFDLTFTPKTAVGSPHPNNSAVVATGTNSVSSSSDIVDNECDAPHDDAVARTYDSNTGRTPRSTSRSCSSSADTDLEHNGRSGPLSLSPNFRAKSAGSHSEGRQHNASYLAVKFSTRSIAG